MPPLTLEQVLARSMRLPRSHGASRAAAALDAPRTPPPPGTRATRTGSGGIANLFSLIEKDEAEATAGRPTIHSSHNLVRTSQDLLTFLHTAKRMRAWEDALRTFCDATKALDIHQTDNGAAIALRDGESGGLTPSDAHLSALVDTCAGARQWALVEQLGELFARRSPATLSHAVVRLAATVPADMEGGERHGWERGLHFLQTRVPPAERPVDAYNACIAACEGTHDWAGALAIVRSMGENPLKVVKAEGEEESAETPVVGTGGADSALGTQPPVPTVVTYATLISVLEQSGKNTLASEVLQRLPPLEKEEITASYAALIHVWSEQKLRRRRRQF